MQKTNRKEKRQTTLWLLLIYSGSVIIRFLLALATRHYPTVSIDEFLYYSLGRSIATKGSLIYLGQPASYNYIIYPLFLSPVYLLFGKGVNYLRLIQLWNIILMSLSVFPFFGLINALVGKRKTALWMTALFMLLPCFILGEYIYSEAIIYPMFYLLMYCAYRYLKENSIRYAIWIGILGALLYYTKPGAVLPAVLALLFFGVNAAVSNFQKAGISILLGMGCLAIGFFTIKLFTEQVFGYHGTLLSVYNNQVIQSADSNIDIFLNAAGKYPYYFFLAGGVFPFLATLWNYPEYKKEDKQFYLFQIICAFLTMIGIAWVVNRPERKELLYLRYVEMYLPILLAFCAIPEENHREVVSDRHRQMNRILCYLVLGYIAICTFVWGCTTGIGKIIESHCMISLSVLFAKHIMGISNIIIVLLIGITLFLLVRNTKKQKIIRICCFILTIFAVLNNLIGYISISSNTDVKLADEAIELHKKIGDREYLYVYTEDQSDYGLDVNSRHNIHQITGSDFLNNIKQNKGKYAPFIPASVRGMNAVYKTPDTDLLILDEKIYPFIQFDSDTTGFVSADNSFRVVYFVKNQQIIDCVMDYNNNLTYTLKIYNEELLHNAVIIHLEIESQKTQTIEIKAEEQYSIQVDEGSHWYQLYIANPIDTYLITLQDGSAKLLGYEVQSAK